MRRVFLLLALLIGVHTFHILRKPNSKNHQEITRIAILRATAKDCERNQNYRTPNPLNSETLAKACGYDHGNFEKAIKIITFHNVMTDITFVNSAKHHFDNEEFTAGKELITTGIDRIVNLVEAVKFDDPRKTLGEILHSLQDFYSHSNWIELGNTKPCTALINPEEPIPNPAEKDQVTCEPHCANGNCGGKFRNAILEGHILTSGYFELISGAGKCSHGGSPDKTTVAGRSWDGINKDYSDSSHGSHHNKAADVAIDASVQLLEKIRERIDRENGNNFRRYREATYKLELNLRRLSKYYKS
ncbi:hypothetical protein PO909_000918 [Leuciscus waleckii]